MAIRKETYSSKLVLKDVVSGSRDVAKSFLALVKTLTYKLKCAII